MHKDVCRFNFNNKVRVKLQRKEIISLYQLKINYRSTLDVLSLNFIVDSRNISKKWIIPAVSFETSWTEFYWGSDEISVRIALTFPLAFYGRLVIAL